jgi:hypothetical protein
LGIYRAGLPAFQPALLNYRQKMQLSGYGHPGIIFLSTLVINKKSTVSTFTLKTRNDYEEVFSRHGCLNGIYVFIRASRFNKPGR